jgi:hypothetical protein
MTIGDVAENVRRAIDYGEHFRRRGFAVYVPHLGYYWPFGWTYEEWMQHDFIWLAKCDVVFRVAGESSGADREVGFAMARGIPVFTSLGDLEAWGIAWGLPPYSDGK